MRWRRKFLLAGVVLATAAGVTACNTGSSSTRASEQAAATDALHQLLLAQPVPQFTFSQLRQNVIEIETAQAQATQTTSFFFNMGVADPVQTCPSVGFPIPSTDQLTNPDQFVGSHNGNVTLPQSESTGVYTGDSTGTYVMCIDAQGRPYADYWEGFVQVVTGPATWDAAKHQVTLTGPPSFAFTKGK